MASKEFKFLEKDNDEWMLAEEIPDIDLFFSQIWLSSFVNNMEKNVGINYKKIMSIYNGLNLKFYYGKEDSNRFAEHVPGLIDKEPQFGHKINKNIYLWSDRLVNFVLALEKIDLKKLASHELWDLYKEHDDIHTELYEWGWLPNAIDMFHSNFTNKLKSYLRKIIDNDEKVNKILVKLTVPKKKSVINLESEDFLKICLKVQNDKSQKDLFKKEIDSIKKKMSPNIRLDILEHYYKYHHLKYLFIGNNGVYSFEDYLRQISDIIKSNVDVAERIKEDENKIKKEIKEKEILIKNLKIDSKYGEFFDMWGDFMLTKIYRRNAQIKCMYMIGRLLREIASRLGLTLEHVRFMLPDEVKHALLDEIVNKTVLDKRLKFCVYYAEKEKEDIFIEIGAEKFKQQIKDEDYSKITEVNGQCGCAGKAQGKVKIIIRPGDMKKMNKGDILVSIATDPDIVPAMKKSAAIITEQGGVTSHAAIVARELGVPCLIGTKIATKVFKDNDLVEVDANKGIAKKINKEEWFVFEEIPDTNAMLIYDITKGYCSEFSNYGLTNLTEFATKTENGIYFMLGKKDEFDTLALESFNKLYNDRKWIKGINKKLIELNNKSFKGFLEIKKLNPKNLSLKEISAVFGKFLKLKHEAQFVGQIPNLVEWNNAYLSNKILEEIDSAIKKKRIKKKTSELFTTLVNPDKKGFFNRENKEFIELIAKIENYPKSLKLIKDKPDEKSLFNELDVPVKKLIIKHTENFGWMGYMYNGPSNDIDYYLKNVIEAFKKYGSSANLKKEFSCRERKILEDKGNALKELGLSANALELIEIAKDFIYGKEFRKDCLIFGFSALSPFLDEISKRLSLDRKKLHVLAFSELTNLDNLKLTNKILDERDTLSLNYVDQFGKPHYSYGDAAKEILKKNINLPELSKANLKLHGQIACSGFAVGEVKIINKKSELQKINQGDIMISVSTNPDLVPAMEKASAIVTDTGGLTCHAAIVAREMNKPCVIGTKFATKTFNDGDLVIVDANDGYIRKINKKEMKIFKREKKETELEKTAEKPKESVAKYDKRTEKILWFDAINKGDTPTVGGKGANLGEMFSKFPVPNGFCITVNAYKRFIERIKGKIDSLLNNLNVEDTAKLDKISKQVRMSILNKNFPEDLKKEIISNYKKLKNKKVAVRSSATAEDLPNASFAGQQETYLDIYNENELIKSVQKCWASLFTSRAIYYREKNSFSHSNVLISVVIQEMVDAKYAGVMFTVDPVNKKYILIEVVEGLGEQLVSGQVTPNTYFMNKNYHKIEEKIEHFSIEPKLIEQISRIGERIEKHYKYPQDIEWAFDKKDRLFILQSRPITTL